jgi:hypothetical protein
MTAGVVTLLLANQTMQSRAERGIEADSSLSTSTVQHSKGTKIRLLLASSRSRVLA